MKFKVGDLVKYCFERNSLFVVVDIQEVRGQQAKFTLYNTTKNKNVTAKFWFEHLKVVSHASR